MTTFEHKAVTVLATGIVVDQSKLGAVNAKDMGTLMSSVYGLGKRVLFVENSNVFFNPKTLVELLKAGNQDWELVAEKFNIGINASELRLIQQADNLLKGIIELAQGIKVSYPFAEVPAGWTVEARLKVINSSVRRIGNNEGYSIGVNTLKRIWLRASKLWLNEAFPVQAPFQVDAAGYRRSGRIHTNRVEVGCQNIHRYELEQFAVTKGWEFP